MKKEMGIGEIPVIKTDITYIKDNIKEISKKQDEILNKIESQYVTRVEFAGVEKDVQSLQSIVNKVAWTIVSIILISVIGLVVKTGAFV